MKIAYWGNGSASKQWRLEDPAKYLNQHGFEVREYDGGITEEATQWADTYVLQGVVDMEGLAMLAAYQGEKGKKIVVEQDDLIDVEDSNPHKKHHELSHSSEIIKTMMGIADLVTTSTPHLADNLKQYSQNVAVLPNSMDLERWDLPKSVNTSNQIRIGWAGSITHIEDIDMVVPALRRLYKDYQNLMLVTVGDIRIKDHLAGLPSEVMVGVPFDCWPAKLHSLRLDIGIAPLRDSEFNRCKSNIKRLEYGIAQYAGVYSPTVYKEPFFEDKGLGLIAENEDEWYEKLKRLIENRNLKESIRRSAYKDVKKRFDLAKNITLWKEAYGHLDR